VSSLLFLILAIHLVHHQGQKFKKKDTTTHNFD